MTVVENVVGEQLVMVPVGDLVPDPTNRPISDASVEELVPSVREHGVLLPILVASDGNTIVDGERRWRAASKVGLECVPCRVSDFEDRRRFVETSAITNLAREDLHPLDQGARLAELLALGHTQTSAAQLLGHGWSQPLVSNRVSVVEALAKLPDATRSTAESAYRAERITVRQAEDLARLVRICVDEENLIPVEQVLAVASSDAGIDGEGERMRSIEVDRSLAPHLTAARRREEVRKARAAIAADGVRDLTGSQIEWVSLRDLTRELDNPLEGHEQLACHAALVTEYADVLTVCTDAASHRSPIEAADPDAGDSFRSQAEIAAAEKAAAASRPVSPEQQAEAERRTARRAQAAELRDGWAARLEVARVATRRARSAGKVLDHLVHALTLDAGNIDWLYEPLADVLDMRDVDRDEFDAALIARAATGGEYAIELAAAIAWAAGELQIREAVNTLDRAFGEPQVAVETVRGIAAYTDRLAIEGHDLTAVELSVATLPAPVDEDDDEEQDDEEQDDDEQAGASGESSERAPMRILASAEWGAYETARAGLIAMPKSSPKAAAFDDAKRAAALALVAEHPDIDGLRSHLEAIATTYRSAWTEGVEDGNGVIASSTLAALQANAADGVVAALTDGTAHALPVALLDAIRDRGEFDAGERPEATQPGQNRRLYVEDLLDACDEARQ